MTKKERIMNDTVAALRAKQLEALRRANRIYRVGATVGLLVFVFALFGLGQGRHNIFYEVCIAFFVAMVGVSDYVRTKKEIRELCALRED